MNSTTSNLFLQEQQQQIHKHKIRKIYSTNVNENEIVMERFVILILLQIVLDFLQLKSVIMV